MLNTTVIINFFVYKGSWSPPVSSQQIYFEFTGIVFQRYLTISKISRILGVIEEKVEHIFQTYTIFRSTLLGLGEEESEGFLGSHF